MQEKQQVNKFLILVLVYKWKTIKLTYQPDQDMVLFGDMIYEKARHIEKAYSTP